MEATTAAGALVKFIGAGWRAEAGEVHFLSQVINVNALKKAPSKAAIIIIIAQSLISPSNLIISTACSVVIIPIS